MDYQNDHIFLCAVYIILKQNCTGKADSHFRNSVKIKFHLKWNSKTKIR